MLGFLQNVLIPQASTDYFAVYFIILFILMRINLSLFTYRSIASVANLSTVSFISYVISNAVLPLILPYL
jgi:hypothetical protein